MPKSKLETSIEKATNENNVGEDWALLLEIVDEINQTNSEKEAIRIITRRLNDKDPHVVNHTLTLLNACVSNCSRNFKLEMSSRIFVDEMRSFVLKKRHQRLSEKLACMIEQWNSETDFKNDPAFNLIPTLYIELKKSGVDFIPEQQPSAQKMKSNTTSADILKEEEDLARAIQLSLKESQKSQASNTSSSTSLYGSLLSNSNSNNKISNNVKSSTNGSSGNRSSGSERRKVMAMYDFEAVEDNEITFKAGDILFIIDESDQNWWKGCDVRGNEGLFPSNFVTSDMSYEVETYETSSNNSKKVSFNNKVNVKMLSNDNNETSGEVDGPPIQSFIDEKKIDDCIDLLQNADPTGEIQPDTRELLDLEDQCYMMGPLIDKQLQKIDQKHAVLEDLNLKILEAFQIYNNLMKESISKTANFIGVPSLSSTSSFANMNLNPVNMGPNSIPYAAAPPTFDQNSLMLANQLNSMTLTSNSSVPVGLPSYLTSQQQQFQMTNTQNQLQQYTLNQQQYTQENQLNQMNNLNVQHQQQQQQQQLPQVPLQQPQQQYYLNSSAAMSNYNQMPQPINNLNQGYSALANVGFKE